MAEEQPPTLPTEPGLGISSASSEESSTDSTQSSSEEEGPLNIPQSLLFNLPIPQAIKPVPHGELEFNKDGPPQDGIKLGGSNPLLENFLLEKFLASNNGEHPPTKVMTKDGSKYRIYCFPARVNKEMSLWVKEWQATQSKETANGS